MLASLKPRGLFEGVCAPGIATAHFCDPPLPPLDSPTTSPKPCSKSNTEVYVLAFCVLVSHHQISLCCLGKENSKGLTMWHMKHIHVADVSTPAAF